MSKARSRISRLAHTSTTASAPNVKSGAAWALRSVRPRPAGFAWSIGPTELTAALSKTIRQRTNDEARTTMTEEQREAAENLHEAMRIFNETVRQAAYRGLHVELQIVEMRMSEGPTPVPQVSASARL